MCPEKRSNARGKSFVRSFVRSFVVFSLVVVLYHVHRCLALFKPYNAKFQICFDVTY